MLNWCYSIAYSKIRLDTPLYIGVSINLSCSASAAQQAVQATCLIAASPNASYYPHAPDG